MLVGLLMLLDDVWFQVPPEPGAFDNRVGGNDGENCNGADDSSDQTGGDDSDQDCQCRETKFVAVNPGDNEIILKRVVRDIENQHHESGGWRDSQSQQKRRKDGDKKADNGQDITNSGEHGEQKCIRNMQDGQRSKAVDGADD